MASCNVKNASLRIVKRLSFAGNADHHILIGKVKEVLKRIESGIYGICEECDEEISEEKLMLDL